MDETHIQDIFLYYFFAYDDVHVCFETVVYRGRELVRWSTCLCDNAIWVFHIFDPGKTLWVLDPLVTPLLVWSHGEVKKRLCLMAPKINVTLPI